MTAKELKNITDDRKILEDAKIKKIYLNNEGRIFDYIDRNLRVECNFCEYEYIFYLRTLLDTLNILDCITLQEQIIKDIRNKYKNLGFKIMVIKKNSDILFKISWK